MKTKQLTEGSSLFLDLLRGFSVQLVVVGHGISFCAIFPALQPPNFPFMQNIAVVIFFLLSGYLISNSIFYNIASTKNYSFTSYFIDRFSRIYSALIPALIFVFFIDYLSVSKGSENYNYTDAFNIKTFIGNIFMLQDFPFFKHVAIKITSFGSARPLWTLAIEWWIYMWFGFLSIKIMKANKLTIINMLIFVFLCIVPAYNIISGRGNGLTIYWLFGLLVCLLYDKYKNLDLQKSIKWIMLLLFLLLAAARVAYTLQEYEGIFVFLLAGSLLISIELCSNLQINISIAKLVRLIANYSYTLYLVHYSIYDFLLSHYKSDYSGNTLFVAGFIISNLIAFTIGYFTETKLTKFVKVKLKKRFV